MEFKEGDAHAVVVSYELKREVLWNEQLKIEQTITFMSNLSKSMGKRFEGPLDKREGSLVFFG